MKTKNSLQNTIDMLILIILKLIILIYINYLSISEVADYMGVSRQAINQAKNRAISKLKKVYLT